MIGVASLIGGDGVSDWGRGILTGLGVSSIGTGGLYCSIDEYCHRCDPQGTRGSGGDATQGDSMIGGLGWVGIWMNSDGSTRGGDGTLGATGGNSMTSLGRDDDGWMYCQITGIGPTLGGGAVTGADGGGSGMAAVVGPPVPSEGPGLGMNTSDGDLLLIVLLRLLRRVCSPSRNV